MVTEKRLRQVEERMFDELSQTRAELEFVKSSLRSYYDPLKNDNELYILFKRFIESVERRLDALFNRTTSIDERFSLLENYLEIRLREQTRIYVKKGETS